jgi:DTW domain-containing protein YfiP
VHAKELKRTTNTGRLAIKALTNSEMRVRGQGREVLDLSDLLKPEYRTLLFYPSDDAVELTKDFVSQDSRPIQLIVPDGNWRQASKVHYRHHELKNISRVKIGEAPLEIHSLRLESKPEGMATLQAIAKALGAIEGPEVEEQLLFLYRAKLERTLIGRGQVKGSI